MADVLDWSCDEVAQWLEKHGYKQYASLFSTKHKIDGKALLLLSERDLKDAPMKIKILGDIKNISELIVNLRFQSQYRINLSENGNKKAGDIKIDSFPYLTHRRHDSEDSLDGTDDVNTDRKFSNKKNGFCKNCLSPKLKRNGVAQKLLPEKHKTLLAFVYCLLVSWITAIVMVFVHDRVPDMKKYPPLPDILLDNIPHIPWAFEICEITGMILLVLWMTVLFFHKHRFILMRRFFAMSGTVFLLRCITMLITSLSVPGTHLECAPRPYGNTWRKLHNAYIIWTGAGLTLQGVRTCGDYMFSGHTVALTMLNFFITEYTPRRIYFLHTFTWLCNCFGIFFILAAHEHYSIDVFIAFYISSRLFLYYHSLVNNRALLMGRDRHRTLYWFPMFSYLETNVDGIVPNEFEWPITLHSIRQNFCTFYNYCFLKVQKKLI